MSSSPKSKGGKGQAPRPAAAAAPRKTWRVNPRAAIGLALLVVVSAAVAGAAWWNQTAKGRPTLLAEARKLSTQKGKDELALSYLKKYLEIKPGDIEAINLKAEILERSVRSIDQYLEIIRLRESLLRREEKATKDTPATLDTPGGQANRRRLVTAYLAVGPSLPTDQQKYKVATDRAAELAAVTKSAEDIRLHAQAMAMMATPANQDPLVAAAARFEEARTLAPGDVVGDEQLALLYLNLKDPAKFDAVLDSLVKTTPTAPAYMAAARCYAAAAADAATSGRSDEAPAFRARADDMIAKAVAADPKGLEVRLEAARIALDAKKPAQAAAHLDAVAENDRQDYRYLTYRGVVALFANKSADAVDSWTRGLAVTGGAEAELSWRLAFVLLNLDRVDEADELIKQYRRLVGTSSGSATDVPPTARYLEALKLLKQNRPIEAIKELETAKFKMPPSLLPQLHHTLGTAYEVVRDTAKAMDEYSEAIKADPKFSPPRLARARLIAASRRGDDAIEELKLALVMIPDDPGPITALARIELDRQRRLPKDKRSWTELQTLLDQGRAVAPGSAALTVIRANAMVAQDKAEAAAELLEKATAIDPADVELWLALAERLVAAGRLDRALEVLDKAMGPKAAGDQAALRIARARILTVRGQGVEAREGLVRDIERVRPSQQPLLWRSLGELYAAQGDAAGALDARRAFTKWAELLPEDPMPRLFVLELALSDPSEDADDTVTKSLDALLGMPGGKDSLYYKIGQATFLLRDRGDEAKAKSEGNETAAKEARDARLSKAERLIDDIEKAAPSARYGPLLRGNLMQQRGNLPAAASAFEKAMRTEGGKAVLPKLVAIYNQMGDAGRSGLEQLAAANPDAAQGITRAEAEAEARAGNKERAETLARKVVAGDPKSLDVRVWATKIFNTLGEPKKAEATLRELVDKNPEAFGPWMTLLQFQVSVKDQEAAHKTAEQLVASVKDLERPELVHGQAWRIAGDRDRADKAFEDALKRWPDDPRVGRAAAEYFTATLRPERSEALLRDILKRDETQQWAARGLALILSGRPAEPTAWLEAWGLVKDTAPGGDLPEDRLVRAIVLSRGPEASNRDAAVVTLSKLVADLPADLPAARVARETLVQSQLRTDPARAAELAAIDARKPGATPAALSLHVAALIASKQLDDADRQLARLDAAAPGALALRIRLLRGRDQTSEAVEQLEKAAAEKIDGPGGEAIGRSIVQIMINELEDDDAALRVAEKLVAKYPKAEGVKAAILARQGHRDQALDIYLRVIAGGDEAAIREAARNSLALVTHDKFDPAAIAHAEKVIDAARVKDPKSGELLAMAGYLRHYQGRYDDELKIYAEALKNSPNDFTLMNNMAWTQSEGLNRPEEALATVTNAIKRSVVVPAQLYDTRGCIYTRLGRLDDAIRDLQIAARERPTGTILAHLARAYHKAGKTAEFEKARDDAKKTGLTPGMLEKSDHGELEALIFGK